MKLAALQYRPPHGQPEVAREQLRELLELARGADLVVCPEMATTGYVFDSAEEIAPFAEAPDGPTFAMLREAAISLGAWVVCGFAERDGDSLYNSALTVSPSGALVSCYRKVLLFEQDEAWAAAGDSRALIKTEKFGVMAPCICMDINDDDFARFLHARRPSVVAFCTNWIEQGYDILPYWRMRLYGWQGWLVVADRWGEERGTTFYGRSAILGPDDAVLGTLPATGDAVLFADTKSGVSEVRRLPCDEV